MEWRDIPQQEQEECFLKLRLQRNHQNLKDIQLLQNDYIPERKKVFFQSF